MSMEKGRIVRATAGRDKDGFFVVISSDKRFALIADGKRRRVEAPKKKSLKHLAATETVIQGSVMTNPQIKRVLRDFNNGG